MEPPRRSRGAGRAAPDEPTRVHSDVGPFGAEDSDPGSDLAAAGFNPQRTEVYRGPGRILGRGGLSKNLAPQDRIASSRYGDSASALAPFSAEPAKPPSRAADPSVFELLTADVELGDFTDETIVAGDSMSALEELNSEDFRVVSAPGLDEAPVYSSAPAPARGQAPSAKAPAKGGSSTPVPALSISRAPLRDFDDGLETRVAAARSRDPSIDLSLSEVQLQGPEEEFDDDGRHDKSVVRRIVKSVVAHLPRAFQTAAVKSGIFKVPSSAGHSSGALSLSGRGDGRLDARAWREARTSPIFDGLPNDALRDAMLEGTLAILRVDRDTIIPVGGGLVLVRSGQIALGQFPADRLEIERDAAEKLIAANPLFGKKLEKKERRRRQKAGALIRQAEKNLATFEEGDVVEVSVAARRHETVGIYSVTPVTVITLDRELAERWRQSYPFMADRLRRAGASAKARVEATAGAKAIVADFFIRHGLSVSMTLRVRKLDACIECGACEKACEDRYGGKRLSLNGRILGNLDFVDACHTCTDQRCIDPCNFDAISFDVARKEVLINEANCTGCTLCAVACPYDAIEMYELDEKPKLKLRLQKANALGHGDGAGRKATLRRIASKCDHCAFYEDQACISACPTGALIEILPSDVVSQMPDQARATARAGFDRTIRVDINALNQIDTFAKKGLAQLPELGRARARRGQLSINFWWFVGIVSLLAVSAEIALRKLRPARSLAYFLFTKVEGFDPELALERVDFRPGCEFAVDLGYIGTALMITGLAYVWRRRMPFMRNVGSLRAWFDWHVLSGVIGPMFILLHSVGRLDNWVSIAFWSMIATVLSGLLGRYLTTQLPQAANSATVETLEVDRQMGKLRIEHPGVRVADGWFEDYRKRLAAFGLRLDGPKRTPRAKEVPHTVGGGVLAIFWLIKDDFARGGRSRRLSRSLRAAVQGPGARRIRRRAHKLAMRLERLERRRVLLPRLEPLFLRWKAIHVPMAIALTIVASVHIFLALKSG
jgi:Fe-S-cluster-containing hydrogenase component 2